VLGVIRHLSLDLALLHWADRRRDIVVALIVAQILFLGSKLGTSGTRSEATHPR
jgi:hypothetical protein